MQKKNKDHLFKHAYKRAWQRYDLEITRAEYEKMCNDIRCKNPNVLFLVKESNTRTHWLVNDYLIAVYHTQLNGICTFRPPDAIHSYLSGSEHFEIRKQIKGWTPFREDD